MARTGGILSLGTRRDATTWEKGCEKLGIKARLPIRKPLPTLEETKDFFGTSAHWCYFGGHFGDSTLSNEQGTAEVLFTATGVTITVAEREAVLSRDARTFQLHQTCEVVLWAGCAVMDDDDTVRTMRKLFGQHLLLGFFDQTGWAVVDAMLGGGFMKTGHFFDRLSAETLDAVSVRDAWMNAALKGYGGAEYEPRFRAVDPDGQEWQLRDRKIVRGRKF